jgi:hypothetical protein
MFFNKLRMFCKSKFDTMENKSRNDWNENDEQDYCVHFNSLT